MDGPTFEELNGEVQLPPPPSMQSMLAKLVMDMAKQPKDIWRLSAPAALLNGVSLLEYAQYYGDHPDLLTAIARCESPRDRLVACVRWYISTLFGSYGSRSGERRASGFERKPYNPILGEQFRCRWMDDDGNMTSELMAEQVSHHPPVSAFYLRTANKVHVHGFTGQSTSFNGTGMRVRQEGRLFVYLEEWREEITITLPELHLFGIATGPYLEITGPALLLSTSGWAADLDFERSGYFFGERDQFTGVVYNNDTGVVDMDVWGDWKRDAYCAAHDDFKRDGKKAGKLFFSHAAHPILKPTLKPVCEQSELESRRVWSAVTMALLKADYEGANTAKNDIENRQRQIRKEREARNEPFVPALFVFTEKFHFLPPCGCEDVLEEEDTDSSSATDDIPSSSGTESDDDTKSPSSSTSSIDAVPYTGRWLSRDFVNKFALDV